MSVLVTHEAPNFIAKTVMPDNSIQDNFDLRDYCNNQKCILFFYPLDFTFVCPSEIIAFDKHLAEFEERNTKVVGVSIDSQFSHLAYKNTPVKQGGIGKIMYPLVSDITKQISRSYDVLFADSVALRGTFLIDENFKVRHQVINDLPLGRNIAECIRMIDALDFHTKHGDVCPANWEKGKKSMKPTQEGVVKYLSNNS